MMGKKTGSDPEEKAAGFRRKIAELETRRKAGDRSENTALAEMYLLGGAVILPDDEKAYQIVQEELSSGNTSSRILTVLGILYMRGNAVEKDPDKAAQMFTRASDAGDMKAPRYLGEMALEKRDYEEARSWYQTGADRGDITSKIRLGEIYEKGLGTKKDLEKAIRWYQSAAARTDHVGKPAADTLRRLLVFNVSEGTEETFHDNDTLIRFRAWRNLPYCFHPKDPIQKLNIFVPAEYVNGGSVCGYTAETAPVFLPNAVGGYMPGEAEEPGLDRFGRVNSLACALKRGCVVVSGGIRGRTSGMESNEFFEGSSSGKSRKEKLTKDGLLTGRAPAFIVDYKAIIRYLRYNRDRIPGDMERIVTSGTSAGGALSALAGATGNSRDYEPFLEEIGALKEQDHIFASSCYCPIHNLENADAAYEWLFSEEHSWHGMKFIRTEEGVRPLPVEGELSDKQIAYAEELKASFPEYVNSLKLKDDDGKLLVLNTDGSGSFRDYVAGQIIASANRELEDHETASGMAWLQVKGSEAERQAFLQKDKEGKLVESIDFPAFVKVITRMKATPAFDALDAASPENEEFGAETGGGRHFTEFSMRHSEVSAEMADPEIIRMLNPTSYIESGSSDVAGYWRIRHGTHDRDTSLAIPVILERLLVKCGKDVDFAMPWGLPHSGDYDLKELFDWIDTIVNG